MAMQMTKEDRTLIRRMRFLRGLFKEFGAALRGFDPGVTASLPGKRGDGYFGETLSFNTLEWEWLEPLLVELRERRKPSPKAGGR